MSTTSTGRAKSGTKNENDAVTRLTTTARQAADTVAGAAGEVVARFPDAADSTREAIQEANRAIAEANRMVRAGSEEQLKVVGAASLGFATGLLFGGANRILVIAALVPAALVGAEYMQRQAGPATD